MQHFMSYYWNAHLEMPKETEDEGELEQIYLLHDRM
jgi:predicted alpha/beta hydrolase